MSDRSSGSPDDSADTHPEPGDVGSVIPALPTTGTPNPAASGAPTSDDPRVDDALSRLGEVETLPLAEQVEAGAMGFKVHEDWGATPAVIDRSLTVADRYDVQVAIHTDTLNECGFVEDTRRAIGGLNCYIKSSWPRRWL